MQFHLWEEILSVLAGAGSWAIISKVVKKARAENVTITEFAARMIQDENFELKQKVNVLESFNAKHIQRIAELERQLSEMQIYNDILKSIPMEWPFPMSMVNFRHEYDYISPLYEEIFLKPFGKTIDDCIGKNMYDVWPDEIAREFVHNNQTVMDSGEIFNNIEHVVDGTGKVHEWQIIKYKRPVPFGVICVALPKNGFFDKKMKKVHE